MSSSDSLKPGDVILVYCRFLPIPKQKYAICVCPNHPLFFFISSMPRTSKPDAQLPISPNELPFLKHDSFVNTGEMVTFGKMDLSKAQLLGHLPDHKKREVAAIVANHPYLPAGQVKIVLKNFS